jgi:hypothetical protein
VAQFSGKQLQIKTFSVACKLGAAISVVGKFGAALAFCLRRCAFAAIDRRVVNWLTLHCTSDSGLAHALRLDLIAGSAPWLSVVLA